MATQRPVYSITPFTMLDYPAHTACIIWFAGCNMRCLYCYNPEIVLGKGKISISDTIAFLKSRQHLLQAVVFSGGECTLHPALALLAQEAKNMGYLVKIDTNGTRPDRLVKLIEGGLIDYIALDFKATPSKFSYISQSSTWNSFVQSFILIQQSNIPFEVRTTWHSELLSFQDLQNMVHFLEQQDYSGNYYIQRFVNHVPTLHDLPYGSQKIDPSHLSSTQIQVILR